MNMEKIKLALLYRRAALATLFGVILGAMKQTNRLFLLLLPVIIAAPIRYVRKQADVPLPTLLMCGEMPNWYSGSKTYIIDSLFLLDGVNHKQEMVMLCDNLPIVYRLLRDEWSEEIGLRILELVLKLVFTCTNEPAVMFTTQLLLRQLLERLEERLEDVVCQNEHYLNAESLLELAVNASASHILLLAYLISYIPTLREPFLAAICLVEHKRTMRAMLHDIFAREPLSDMRYVQFCADVCSVAAADTRCVSTFVRAVATAPSQLNFCVFFAGNYEITDFVLTQPLLPDDFRILMLDPGESQKLPGNRVVVRPYSASQKECENAQQTLEFAVTFTTADAYMEQTEAVHAHLRGKFPILSDTNALDAISDVTAVPEFRALRFFVGAAQIQHLPRNPVHYIAIYVSKRLLIAHNCAFCAAALAQLNAIKTARIAQNQPKKREQYLRAIRALMRLQELVNGPSHVLAHIFTLVNELSEEFSLRSKEK